MRRGHPGRGGWRNEGPRHFRPRTGVSPGFRPPRSFPPPLLDTHRFPAQHGPRFGTPEVRRHRGRPPFTNRPGHHEDRTRSEFQNRNKYQILNRQLEHRNQELNQSYPQLEDYSEDIDDRELYANHGATYHVNSMGDVDQRPLPFVVSSQQDSFQQQDIPPWVTRPPPRSYRRVEDVSHETIANRLQQQDYTGHRPPSSDHYDKARPPVESDSFTRSVDDTVDIIRKRLQNRNDPQHQVAPNNQDLDEVESSREPIMNSYQQQNMQQEQVQRKKPQRPRNTKPNSDKIKNNIVHQLFKMDKDRIHKLMDNPNSSTKFEYAINSLINESQNNYNRHMRAAAEKSLCVSRNEIIQYNETDNIYEDTFMKQMQCILEPHDTVFLEDIKPLVMAELNKILQLNEFELNPMSIEEVDYQMRDYQNHEQDRACGAYPDYGGDCQNDQQYYEGHSSYTEPNQFGSHHDRSENHITEASVTDADYVSESSRNFEDTSSIFERKGVRQSSDYNRNSRRSSPENKLTERSRRTSGSVDRKPNMEAPTPYADYGSESSRNFEDTSSLFERKGARQSSDYNRKSRRSSSENRLTERSRRSSDSVDRKPKLEAPTPYADYGSDSSRNFEDTSSLFERKGAREISDYNINSRKSSIENRLTERSRRPSGSVDRKPNIETPTPYFDVNTEQLSDDEDPFAELDKQYHVAVDHAFIEAEDPTMIDYTNASKSSSKNDMTNDYYPKTNSPHKTSIQNEKRRSSKTRLSLELLENSKELPDDINILTALENQIKTELLHCEEPLKVVAETTPIKHEKNLESVKKEKVYENREELHKSDSSNTSLEKSSQHSNGRKRSTDQRPSHRKEKRKKSESSPADETNKEILNKKVIIKLSDCVALGKSDKFAASVSSFFSKTQTGSEEKKDGVKNEGTDSGYSEKYVKRKDSPQKPHKEKSIDSKKRDNSSTSNHSTSDSKDCKDTHNNINQTPSKHDSKTKLKSIDMFTNLPRKSATNQALRNTASSTSKTSSTPNDEKVEKVRTLPIKSISKQVTRRHVATQAVRKLYSKECQTSESKSSTSRCTQTVIRIGTKAIQTDPVSLDKLVKPKAQDAFERMKEIDMEIQVLLQEKFQLYNNLESKESHQSSIQNLGMTVLSVATNDDLKDSSNADNIAADFTNIPEDELEQIAFEAVEHNDIMEPRGKKKKNRCQQLQETSRKRSQSPSTPKKKKSKTPNISLLEQIITDDRPLEDIISLDYLETSPKTKVTKKSKKVPPRRNTDAKKAKKKQSQRALADAIARYGINPCYVLLEDLARSITPKKERIPEKKSLKDDEIPKTSKTHESKLEKYEDLTEELNEELIEDPTEVLKEELIEEPVNDFQFQVDMLDVCEDIFIDSNCDKADNKEEVYVAVSEEIVLDNSQSVEEVNATETADGHKGQNCRMYDYSADEDLKHDSVSITGNGDSVLAIECIESNFLAACLDGNVYYFNSDGALLTTLRGSNLAVTCFTIVHEKYGTTVYTGSLDSRIRYYDLESGMEKGPECNVLSPIQSMDRAWDTVFVGTRTGFVLQFECKNNMLIPVSTIKFSDQSILALRALKEGPRKVLLVAARSENVTIKDAQTGLLLRTLEGPKMTVYTLLYEEGKVYCGTSSHQIQVFDYTSGSHCNSHEGGKGAVCLRSAGGILFAGCYDGCVYVYRAGERHAFAQLRGPGVMLLSLAVVGSKIIVGYNDRSLYIWKIPVNILREMVL